jgi:hypothetical protein
VSGYQRPLSPGAPRMNLTRAAPGTPNADVINQAFTLLEMADGQNVKRGQETQQRSMLLTAQTGQTVRLTVTVTGSGTDVDPYVPTLALAMVPRP